MAFSGRARRPALSAAELKAAAENFQGKWTDDEGAVVTIQDHRMFGPEGITMAFEYLSVNSCSFKMHGEDGPETYKGKLMSDGRLVWDDGAVWVRAVAAAGKRDPAPQPAEAGERSPSSAEEKTTKSYDDSRQRLYEEERARKAAELQRLKAQQADRGPDVEDGDVSPRTRRAQEGMDRARQAYEEEKAKKAAALARVRAKAKAGPPAPSPVSSVEQARLAFQEARQARRNLAMGSSEKPAAAAAAADKEVAAEAAARRRSEEGQERARTALEEEKARKAAVLEKARATHAAATAAANARSQAPGGASGSSKPAGREEDAIERARRTFEAEKARKAETLRAARAKATAKGGPAELAPGDRFRPDPRPSQGSATGASSSTDNVSLGISRFANAKLATSSEASSLLSVDEPELAMGILVKMRDLKARPELNGTIGMLINYDASKQRWQVRRETGEDMLFKKENLQVLSQPEFEVLVKQRQGRSEDDEDRNLDKDIPTRASGERMRWGDTIEGAIKRGPTEFGNQFDVFMADEEDGVKNAEKIVETLEERGVCLCEANAPHDLLAQAFREAEDLWEAGAFGPPMHVYDEEGNYEAQVWQQVLYQDERKVIWINPDENGSRLADKMEALNLLSQNMLEFCRGLGDILQQRMGITFTHLWNAMLSCYMGEQSYVVHYDNPYRVEGGDRNLPDNGLRITLNYWINPHWNPEDGCNGGGLDVFLADPHGTPCSAQTARKMDRLRIAPHADTLALFLSDRMPHQVIATKGREKWFCLTMWGFEQEYMESFFPKIQEKTFRERRRSDDSDED